MFKYFLHIAGQRIEVSPKDTAKLKKVTEREKDQIFYREKLSGSLVFKGEDFQRLYEVESSADRCTEIGFTIEKECNGLWREDWKGYFSCNDVKWNLNTCSATVTPKPDDKYRAILENYSKEYNLLNSTPIAATLELDLEAEFEFITSTEAAIMDREDADTWVQFLYVRNLVFTRKTLVYFRLKRTAPLVNGEAPELNGWSLLSKDETTAYYAKAPDLYNFKRYEIRSLDHVATPPYPELITASCGTPAPEGMIDVGCIEIFFEGAGLQYFWKFGAFTFDRNRSFFQVLRYLVTQTADHTLLPAEDSQLSRFFTSETNYVTLRQNTLTGLQIASLSDVIGYNSTEAATRADWSLKKLLDSLRQLFRVFWDLDNEGKLRLEHESFFQLQGERDLTIHTKELRASEVYEYVTSKMPRYQRLLFQNANNEDFEKGEIEYSGACVTVEEGQDTQNEQVNEVTTDLEYLIVSGGGSAQRGFVFMLVQNGVVLKERGDYTGQLLPNAGLSAANLIKDYYTHNRVLENGAVNGRLKTFASVQKTKKQMALSIPACCDAINPYSTFITGLGRNGELESMSQSLTTGTTELTLLHTTTGSGLLTIGKQFSEQFDDSFN